MRLDGSKSAAFKVHRNGASRQERAETQTRASVVVLEGVTLHHHCNGTFAMKVVGISYTKCDDQST